MLNILWLSFFLISFVTACIRAFYLGEADVFSSLTEALFDMAKMAFEIALGLIGVLSFWLGMLRIAERAGIVTAMARGLGPLFRYLMPGVPPGHPALGTMTMNFAANILGLDNAATPVGLKTMQHLQDLNPTPARATNAQILFLVINASSITLLPLTIFMYRAQQGATDPTMVFVPILLATTASTIVGLLTVAWMQRLPLWRMTVFAYFAGFGLLLGGLIAYLLSLPSTELTHQSSLLGHVLLLSCVVAFLCIAYWRRVAVYETFIEGAKEGFHIAVQLIPYLVAMLVAVGWLRASGVLDGLLYGLTFILEKLGLDTAFVPALPTALMKPFSGSGARAMVLETMKNYGVDSFPALVAAVIQGSTETTFYVVAVYFGSVGITNVRHTITCALLADLAGVIAAIGVCYWFFA